MDYFKRWKENTNKSRPGKKEKTLQDKLKERLTKTGGTADGKTQQTGRDEQGRKDSLREVCEGYRKEIAGIQRRGLGTRNYDRIRERFPGFLERRLELERSSNGDRNGISIIKGNNKTNLIFLKME
jgi:hypothetical protein